MTIIVSFYLLILGGLSLYSYALIDPNMTFFNHPLWSRFLEWVLQLGYYQRQLSWQIYLGLVILLFIFQFLLVKNYRKINPVKLALLVAGLLLLSYPFLSHDFIKYMFDAKILTFYHKNPYLTRPIDISYDPWIRFMQWIEQPFRYGIVFLTVIVVPSALSMGKFLLSFVFLKIVFAFFYILSVIYLGKMNRRWAVIFATHPLIIIEGLVNGHNDIIGVSLVIIGIYWLFKKPIIGRLFLLLSIGIKYLALPVILLSKNKKSWINKLIFILYIILLFSLFHQFMSTLFMNEILSWYFIILLGFLPFYEEVITKFNVMFFGLLVSYYPFIRFGDWIQWNGIPVRHWIIIIFSLINLLLFLIIPKWRKALFNFITGVKQ